jgi:hypothetical protein
MGIYAKTGLLLGIFGAQFHKFPNCPGFLGDGKEGFPVADSAFLTTLFAFRIAELPFDAGLCQPGQGFFYYRSKE